VPLADRVEGWSDQARLFMTSLRRRIPEQVANKLQTGKSLEKSIAPLRSFVVEPLRFRPSVSCRRCGAHCTADGAKGLNLAVSNVRYLSDALSEYYLERSGAGSMPIHKKRWHLSGRPHVFPGL